MWSEGIEARVGPLLERVQGKRSETLAQVFEKLDELCTKDDDFVPKMMNFP